MNSRNREAMEARLRKEAHPERWCKTKRCLWRLARGACPRHAGAPENMTPGALMDQEQANHERDMDATEEIPAVEMAEEFE